MSRDQIKKLTKMLVPAALAIAAAYGYVDNNCSCEDNADVTVPASSGSADPE